LSTPPGDAPVPASRRPLAGEAVLLGAGAAMALAAAAGGPWRWLAAAAAVAGAAAAYHMQRRARREHAELEAALGAVLDTVSDAVFVKDLDGRYLRVNAAAAALLGRAAEDARGADDRAFFTPAEARETSERDREALERGRPVTSEHTLTVGAAPRPFLTTKAPFRGADGRVRGLVVVCRDRTGTGRAEDALRRAEKLESLGLLAGGVAHDFNNLLVAMLGQTSLALSRLSADSPARMHLEKAVTAAERATELTRQMLVYAGRGQLRLRPLDLNALVAENLKLLATSASPRVVLTADLGPDLPRVDADMAQVQEIVLNLVSNAMEAIGEGSGTVIVTTRAARLDGSDVERPNRTGERLPPGEYAALEVRDDGPGIDAVTLERIFDPFFTTKLTRRGLGLASVLGIVRGHHGSLTVESQPALGTTFRLLFPVARLAAPSEPGPATPKLPVVLVIDDEEVVRDTISDTLGMHGIPCLVARSGDEGLALYREHASELGLVLLDLSMPGRSGPDTYRELRRLDPGLPILLSSGYGEKQARLELGTDDLAGFLPKPYREATLVTEILRCLRASPRGGAPA
jgi:PAS domain S-box-containing protein